MSERMTVFCDFEQLSLGTTCHRCGSWSREGVPECPPWVTRSEPDNARLPHILTDEQNQAVMDAWLEEQWSRPRETNT